MTLAELKEILKQIGLQHAELQRLRDEAAKIEACSAALHKNQRAVLKYLEENDLRSDGNMGYEGRILHFLTKLTRSD